MAKIDKKRNKLTERIALLEDEMRTSLSKKSSVTEINVSAQMEKIRLAKKQLSELK